MVASRSGLHNGGVAVGRTRTPLQQALQPAAGGRRVGGWTSRDSSGQPLSTQCSTLLAGLANAEGSRTPSQKRSGTSMVIMRQ